MVTMCTPNGFGDLMLNMKDPSGTIDASVHKKVLTNENISKGLSVGSVIILKQVAVLRPSNTVCYLNVTQKNIEKVLKKDSVTPCKQVVPSSNSERQSQQPDNEVTVKFAGQGDSMEREAGAKTSDGITSILSKISRTKESPMTELLSDNGVNSSILRRNKDTHGVQNHHEELFEQMDLSSQIQNLPGSSSSQRLQKIIHSMNPANCQVKHGGSVPKCGITSEAQRSTDDVMRKLIGVDTMKPFSKDITVAEGSRHNRGTPDASMDADARCRSEKPQEIGLQKMVEGHSLRRVSDSNRDERQQQNPSANTRCSQSILVGKNKSDAIVSDGNGARMNDNINTSRMDTEYGLENSLNIGLDDITEGFHGNHSSIRKFEHQQKDLHAASAGTLQPTQENCSISVTSGTSLSNHKMVSVCPVAEWTDEQLSELFADY
ncbi:hypothetical protein ACQ4PT_001350 [Festuca glaucescens]